MIEKMTAGRHIAQYEKEICIQAAKTKLCGLSGIESIEPGYVDGLHVMESGQVEGEKEMTINQSGYYCMEMIGP